MHEEECGLSPAMADYALQKLIDVLRAKIATLSVTCHGCMHWQTNACPGESPYRYFKPSAYDKKCGEFSECEQLMIAKDKLAMLLLTHGGSRKIVG